jgi:integration host factor subunit alpha
LSQTKKDLIRSIQTETSYSEKLCLEMVESLLEQIKSSLENGDDVLISGFGKFCVKEKDSRKGRNPATCNEMLLDARRVVTFKCLGTLRDKLNGKGL